MLNISLMRKLVMSFSTKGIVLLTFTKILTAIQLLRTLDNGKAILDHVRVKVLDSWKVEWDERSTIFETLFIDDKKIKNKRKKFDNKRWLIIFLTILTMSLIFLAIRWDDDYNVTLDWEANWYHSEDIDKSKWLWTNCKIIVTDWKCTTDNDWMQSDIKYNK